MMSKLKVTAKSMLVIVLAAALSLFALPFGLFRSHAQATQGAAEGEGGKVSKSTVASVEFTLNYWRKDQTYTGWDVWMWAEGANGEGVEFSAEANVTGKTGKWKIAKKTFTSLADNAKIGFIVRKGGNSWSGKDPGPDMFVNVSDAVDGKIEIWIVTGDENIYDSEEEAIKSMGNKISSANFVFVKNATTHKDDLVVRVSTSDKITNKSHLKVKNSEGEVVCDVDFTDPDLNAETKSIIGKRLVDMVVPVDMGELDEEEACALMSDIYTVVDEPEVRDDDKCFAPKKVRKAELFNTEWFTENFVYDGALGADYTSAKTTFRVWSPLATSVSVKLYSAGKGGELISTTPMELGEKGVWSVEISGDLNGKYYTYSATVEGNTEEAVDPYAVSAGENGNRGMILDLAATNPTGWADQKNPELKSNSSAVIYEAQLRDLTIHESSGVSAANRGKFLGLTETGTKNAKGSSTALDYLKELGVTEVHFQPLFDFASVDENFTTATYDKAGEYNWGYDPKNYNVPEGSYSSDPTDGAKRVNEMKQMVMALHNAGIQVVMDVVFNHMNSLSDSPFEKLMPGYYFRTSEDGKALNGSGCGNETASERAMFGKFMIDSVLYWTKEYKIDGFRFDLMALHDTDTMNALYDELKKVNPDVIVYGEGWDAGSNGLDKSKQANIANSENTPNIAYFNDVIRNGIRGGVFDATEAGFVQGLGKESCIYVGATAKTNSGFTGNPTQSVSYSVCHDNSTLWDRLNASVAVATKDELKAMNRLAAAVVLTSQGPTFILAGEEMLRSKPTTKDNDFDNRPTKYATDPTYYFSDNSYKSSDSVNAINWNLIDENADMVEFYKQLIAIKTSLPQFQLTTKAQIRTNVIQIDEELTDGVAMYAVKDPGSDNYAVVLFNNHAEPVRISVPKGKYKVLVDGAKANAKDGVAKFSGSTYTVGARSAVIMTGELSEDVVAGWKYSVKEGSNLGLALGLGIGIPAAVLIAGGVVFGVMYKKKKGGKKPAGDGEGKADGDAEGAPEEDVPDEHVKEGEGLPEDAPAEDVPDEHVKEGEGLPEDAPAEEAPAEEPQDKE